MSALKDSFANNKGLWIFFCCAFLVALVLAAVVSPLASKSPDGLEKVAKDKGFSSRAKEGNGALKDYAVPGMKSESASTRISSVVGVFIVLGVGLLVGLLVYGLGRLRKRRGAGADEA
jgi:cobalt/nickel transport protein